jgi:phytoene desaturase
MQSPLAVVIGSGVGGMAVAIRLAVKGYSVTVYEKNASAGGKLDLFEKDGYQFDAGPSLFTQPQLIEELFALAGEPIDPYFQYTPVPLACRYFWENGKSVDAFTHPDSLAREMNQKLGEDPEKVKKYLKRADKAYSSIGTLFLDHPLHRSATWLSRKLLPAISATRLGYLTSTMHGFNRSWFKSAEAVQLFDRFATYNGSDPYQAPAMLTMIPHLEHNEGVFYPKGGMISIPTALYQLALKKGVKFVFNTRVEKINHQGNEVQGIQVGGKQVKAELVVSNMDVYYVHKELLNDEKATAKVLKRERSSSALIFYWGIRKSFPKLHLHNIFFSENYKAEFEHLFKLQRMYDDPTIYINITSKMEAGFCPEGHENWFVMVNAPAESGQDWPAMIARTRTLILQKLKRMLGEDIASQIATEIILDPVGIEKHSLSYRGSLYGTSSNEKLAAFLRHNNDSSSLKGLYFTGGSVHPGGGIPLCLKSAQIVAGMVSP